MDRNNRNDFQAAKTEARKFFTWLHNESNNSNGFNQQDLLSGIDRGRVGELFRQFHRSQESQSSARSKQLRFFESLVMAKLRDLSLMKSKRYEDAGVICYFALSDKQKTFAPIQERKTAREKIRQRLNELRANKNGVIISTEPTCRGNVEVMPMNEDVKLDFDVELDATQRSDKARSNARLVKLTLSGPHSSSFKLVTKPPINMAQTERFKIRLVFRATRTGLYRASLTFEFERNIDGVVVPFHIARSMKARSGDPDVYDAIKVKVPYTKKVRKARDERPTPSKDVVRPPRKKSRFQYVKLDDFKIPKYVRGLVEAKEMEETLKSCFPFGENVTEAEFSETYKTFWQHLLWMHELQAYRDIELFDLENVAFERSGRFFKLRVAGLAEGRPSVLRGDIVKCRWKSKEYLGRVVSVGLLYVLLEFHESFHRNFDVNIDRIEKVRFTFTRTSYRTSHAGVIASIKSMKRLILMPTKNDVETAVPYQRNCPSRIPWTGELNDEQKRAVREILKGTLRPFPYIIFGPPGTGKTTTLVEAVYQLAKLPIDSRMKTSKREKLRILLVAPSNDAADILVARLSQYFPPSQMVRVLAFSRPLDQVPESIRQYCAQGTEANGFISKILNMQITVATINMAARFWCTGTTVPNGHFDVLCVDEAGHATEPEVITAAAKLMAFHEKDTSGMNMGGQLILAGDPMQLGPIITSSLCKKFKMDQSYIERLIKSSTAYRISDHDVSNVMYPPELVTLLVRNYRSHPDILKLPNKMFYDNQLIPCGDIFTTHSMSKWEHLPKMGFPVLFHSVDGENTREGNSPSWFNPEEAMVTVQYVKDLVENSKPKISPEEIGIITPYARQVQKIRIALRVEDVGDVKVGSVETFQGQERRVIIISTVRSENDLLAHDLKYNLGFVANEKRFNVAMTRAKALLIVVGNPRVLATDEKNWLHFLRFCHANGSWYGDPWDESDSTEGDGDIRSNASVGETDDDSDEWEVVANEAHGFINREE